MNHLDPRPRQRDSLADANLPEEEDGSGVNSLRRVASPSKCVLAVAQFESQNVLRKARSAGSEPMMPNERRDAQRSVCLIFRREYSLCKTHHLVVE